MKLIEIFAVRCIVLLLFISLIALSVFTKYDRNTLITDQISSMQISSYESLSFQADEDYLMVLFNKCSPTSLIQTTEKKPFHVILFANFFPEIVIPPPNLSI